MKTVDRGLALLEFIIEAQEPVSIHVLMELTKLDRSTIYRYIKVLVDRRYIQNDPQMRGYVAGFRTLELSGAILTNLSIRDVARPHLLSISNTFSLTAHLAIRDVDQVLYLDKIESQRSLPIISRIGSRAPLYCTSLGKLFLAFEDPAISNDLLPKLGFLRRTATTIRDVGQLKRELAAIREKGFAVDNEENEVGIYCMAAPIFDVSGAICAAISVTGLTSQFQSKAPIVDELRHAASEISRALGGPTAEAVGA